MEMFKLSWLSTNFKLQQSTEHFYWEDIMVQSNDKSSWWKRAWSQAQHGQWGNCFHLQHPWLSVPSMCTVLFKWSKSKAGKCQQPGKKSSVSGLWTEASPPVYCPKSISCKTCPTKAVQSSPPLQLAYFPFLILYTLNCTIHPIVGQ